jgi:hypothetical protein
MVATIRYIFTFAGMFLLCGAGIECLRGNKSATLACIPAALLLLFGNLSQVDSFKVGVSSIEATLSAKVTDAQRIIDQLRGLAVNTAKSLIQLRENSNALVTSIDFPAEDAYKASVVQSLKDMEIPAEAIKEVEQSDSNVVVGFYAYAAFRFASDGFLPDDKKRQEFNTAYAALSDAQKHSPVELEALFNRFHVDGTRFSPYMEDFRYYLSNKEQRRPEEWAKRETWGFGRTTPGSVFPMH